MSYRSATVPARWGIRMDGVGGLLTDLISQHSAALPLDHVYTLIEVGSAGCVTLRAFSDILRELRGDKWRAIGFDLTPDKAWSLDMAEVERSFAGLPERIIIAPGGLDAMMGQIQGMMLLLMDDPRTYLVSSFPYPIDLAFIDASHGISCGRDFLAIERKVVPGGIVVFHDYGEPEQGTDWQAFDREFISVRSYVHRLGLNQPSNGTRKGWRWVGEIKGSRHWGGDGNSAAVVQRTEEPLVDQPELSL